MEFLFAISFSVLALKKKKIRIVIVLGCFNNLREFDAFVCVQLDRFLPAGVIVRAGTTQ